LESLARELIKATKRIKIAYSHIAAKTGSGLSIASITSDKATSDMIDLDVVGTLLSRHVAVQEE
jgi:hypothetical protein